ncbi:MAG: hypothetical protein WKF43_03085 [Acidimicrobiales bacterium]
MASGSSVDRVQKSNWPRSMLSRSMSISAGAVIEALLFARRPSGRVAATLSEGLQGSGHRTMDLVVDGHVRATLTFTASTTSAVVVGRATDNPCTVGEGRQIHAMRRPEQQLEAIVGDDPAGAGTRRSRPRRCRRRRR